MLFKFWSFHELDFPFAMGDGNRDGLFPCRCTANCLFFQVAEGIMEPADGGQARKCVGKYDVLT